MNSTLNNPEVLHFLRDMDYKLPAADDIRGKVLHDVSGKPIGKIEDLVVNHDGNKVIFLEVESHALFSHKKMLIPVEDVAVHTDHELYLTSKGECTDETPWNCPELIHESDPNMVVRIID